MKRYVYAGALFVATLSANAQGDLNTAADAVRYSLDNMTGTARFRAMGGAMGALGGDLSAMMVNPAGAAVYNFNSGTATVSNYNSKNKANYYGHETLDTNTALDLNQIGAVFVFTNADEAAFMQKFTLGFNLENINSFENNYFLAGTGPNSIDRYFLRYANGVGNEGPIPLSTLNNGNYDYMSFIDQQAYLGYNGYIFNPVSQEDNTTYVSNVPGGPYHQQSGIDNTGSTRQVAFNVATQFKQRFYLGLNLNLHIADYVNTIRYSEDVNGPVQSGPQSIDFYNQRYSYGGGFSFGLGGIVKITDALRAGLSWKSPTWLRLQDEITQTLTVYCPECEAGGSGMIYLDPQATYVLNDYTVKSPGKWTGSLAYVFGQAGLISVDYALQDYSNTKFSGNDYTLVNNELSQTLGKAGELRVGTEWRYKKFSFRGGYRYAQSPYKNGHTVGDLQGYSGGVGLSFGTSKLDLGYTWYCRDADVSLLTPGLVDAARVRTTSNNIVLSYTIDL